MEEWWIKGVIGLVRGKESAVKLVFTISNVPRSRRTLYYAFVKSSAVGLTLILLHDNSLELPWMTKITLLRKASFQSHDQQRVSEF